MPIQKKRPASSAAPAFDAVAPMQESEDKKRRVADEPQDNAHAIGQVVKSAEGYPAQVLDMLSMTLPTIIKTPAQDRHEFEHNMANMVNEVLGSVLTKRNAQAAALKRSLAETDSEKTTRETALENAVAKEEACKEDFERASEALNQAKAAKVAAAEALGNFSSDMQKVASDAEAADAELEECMKVISIFRKLEGEAANQPPAAEAPAEVEGSVAVEEQEVEGEETAKKDSAAIVM